MQHNIHQGYLCVYVCIYTCIWQLLFCFDEGKLTCLHSVCQPTWSSKHRHTTRAHIQSKAFCVPRLRGPDLYTSTNEKAPYILYIYIYMWPPFKFPIRNHLHKRLHRGQIQLRLRRHRRHALAAHQSPCHPACGPMKDPYYGPFNGIYVSIWIYERIQIAV